MLSHNDNWHSFPIEGGTWGVYTINTPPIPATPIEASVENANIINNAPRMYRVLVRILREFDGYDSDGLDEAATIIGDVESM